MADTQSGCAKATLTTVIVLLGAIVGVVIGGLSGFFFGGVLGYVLLRQTDLMRRLRASRKLSAGKRVLYSRTRCPLSPPLVPPPSRPASSLARPPAAPPPATSPPAASPHRFEKRCHSRRLPLQNPLPTLLRHQHIPRPGARTTAQRAGDRNVQAEPSLDSANTLANTLKTWVTTGNVPVKVGVLVSLVGLGFLIQEANERGFITLTIEMGLIAVALFGLALLAIGWRLRRTHTIYGLSLQVEGSPPSI